jgi:8-oxo-dGTP pyrophosphatase MutT (NUDIX family)
MDYVAELRELVGTRPLVLPGTSVLVVDERERLLLVNRADTGGWGLPGGLMEPGESFEDAGRREVREETALEVVSLILFGVFSGAEYYYRYPNGDEIFNVTAAYVASVTRPTVRVDNTETSGYRFFNLDELPPDIIEPERPIVDEYVRATTKP